GLFRQDYRPGGTISFYSAPATQVTPATSLAPVTSQSFYNAPEQDNRAVQVRLRVPTGARIWFEDVPTVQTGTARQFISPPLTAGKAYVYHIRAQWNEGGQ